MPVVLDPPSQLLFERPLTQPIEHVLHLQNVGTEPIAFKVKTTTPKQYIVKPNVGIISPSSQAQVQVVFQPFKEEPAPDFKCKDKFLVLTAQVRSEWSELNIMQFWSLVETDYAEIVTRQKVKCVFLPPKLPHPSTLGQDLDEYERTSLDINRPVDTRNDADPPSPTIPSSNAFYSSHKMYDPSASTTSLFSAHTAIQSTPVHRPLLTTPYFSVSPDPPSNLQQLREENEQLQHHLTTVRSHNIALGQQLIKEQAELKSANALTEQLKDRLKQLDQDTSILVPMQPGYPPQVLLSVSALVFIVTLLFF